MSTEQAITLNDGEQARLDEHVADLTQRGYTEVAEHGPLRVGTRVRHFGQRWPEAYSDGTGNVLRIFHRPDSSWERKYRAPDVEIVVVLDKPRGFRDDDRLMFVANYHVEVTR